MLLEQRSPIIFVITDVYICLFLTFIQFENVVNLGSLIYYSLGEIYLCLSWYFNIIDILSMWDASTSFARLIIAVPRVGVHEDVLLTDTASL